MNKVNKLVSYMKTDAHTKDIQIRQTAHRLRLVEAFDIKPGHRVLEIGCGQGDTTVVLADAVGKTGHVHAIDIASSDYGAPMTLKEATDFIAQSNIGNRITFQFETDVSKESFEQKYDVVILSHSLFYFSSIKDLVKVFKKARTFADRICVADWDLTVKNYQQTAHAQAIIMQALYAQTSETNANIRIIITKELISDLLEQGKWQVTSVQNVDAADLDDARWEIYNANQIDSVELEPALSAFKKLNEDTSKLGKIEALDSFVILAEFSVEL